MISEYVNWLLSFVRIVSSIIFKTSSLGNNIPTLLFQLLIIMSHHFLNRINIITMDYSPLLRSLSFWYSKYPLKSHHKSEWTLFLFGTISHWLNFDSDVIINTGIFTEKCFHTVKYAIGALRKWKAVANKIHLDLTIVRSSSWSIIPGRSLPDDHLGTKSYSLNSLIGKWHLTVLMI